jgi:hypothetical protein
LQSNFANESFTELVIEQEKTLYPNGRIFASLSPIVESKTDEVVDESTTQTEI